MRSFSARADDSSLAKEELARKVEGKRAKGESFSRLTELGAA